VRRESHLSRHNADHGITRVVSFDVDGTIVESAFNDVIWLQVIPELYGRIHDIAFAEARQHVTRAYEAIGEYDVRWYQLDYWLDRFQLGVTQEELLRRHGHHVRAYPDAVDAVRRLRDRFILIVNSGMSDEFIRVKLEQVGLREHFQHLFSAVSLFHVVKTHHYYQRMCELLQVSPAEIVHVGDHYDYDYVAARRAGLQAWFLQRDGGSRQGPFVVSDLREFADHFNEGDGLEAPNSDHRPRGEVR